MIRLETSRSTGIANYQGNEIAAVQLNWAKDIGKQFPHVIPRTPPSPVYNCHGLTFASRRTRIETNRDIRTILTDDQYQEVPFQATLPGDVVIYYSEGGDPTHSGIVVEVGGKLVAPMICSKWGNAGEFVHPLGDCPAIYGRVYRFLRCRL